MKAGNRKDLEKVGGLEWVKALRNRSWLGRNSLNGRRSKQGRKPLLAVSARLTARITGGTSLLCCVFVGGVLSAPAIGTRSSS